MKKILTFCLIALSIAIASPATAQVKKLNAPLHIASNSSLKIYDPTRDAMKDIDVAIRKAATEQRYVLCQIGGNWCPWCLKFIDFVQHDSIINNFINENFVYIHVNYSRENKNPEVMERLGNPGRFGFPVFVIINEKGIPIHIQNSSYLEEDKGYSPKKVFEFLANWTPKAVNTLK